MTDSARPPHQDHPDHSHDDQRPFSAAQSPGAQGSAAPDHAAPDIAFEESIARIGASLRHRASLPDPSRPSLRGVLAFLALVLVAGVSAFVLLRPSSRPWDVRTLAGSPTIDGEAGASKLRERQWLTTAANERATLTIPSIGSVTIEPDSRLRLVRSRAKQQQMELARGTLHATITAPPRLFVVDTPAAKATDMGCIYTLSVEPDGATLLKVGVGWVELSGRQGLTRVSAGLECRTSADGRVGFPRAIASSLTQEQLAAFDPAAAGDAELDSLLTACDQVDGVTLWHILQRVPEADRAKVLDRLAALHPTPTEAPRERTLALDHAALEAWWNQLR